MTDAAGPSGEPPSQQAELLLSTLSHDLRGPLATIASIARTLEARGDQLDEDTRIELIHRIGDKAERLGRLVGELLDVTRMDGGQLVVARTPIRVDRHVAEIVTDIDESGRVVTELDPLTAPVDPMMTARIVTNLLRNALEHAGPEAAVWVRLRSVHSGIELTVEDDGEGVPEQDKPHLFDAFHTSTGTKGTGFGLAAVARFAALMGGSVEVGDREGGGARFTVLLPTPREAEGDLVLLTDVDRVAAN